jgi:hypothetical protein
MEHPVPDIHGETGSRNEKKPGLLTETGPFSGV